MSGRARATLLIAGFLWMTTLTSTSGPSIAGSATHCDVDTLKQCVCVNQATEVTCRNAGFIELPDGLSSATVKLLLGYKQGEGLCKHRQGRVAPITTTKQKGRRGLGLVVPSIDLSTIKYDPEQEVIELRGKVNRLNYMTFSEFDSCMRLVRKSSHLKTRITFLRPLHFEEGIDVSTIGSVVKVSGAKLS